MSNETDDEGLEESSVELVALLIDSSGSALRSIIVGADACFQAVDSSLRGGLSSVFTVSEQLFSRSLFQLNAFSSGNQEASYELLIVSKNKNTESEWNRKSPTEGKNIPSAGAGHHGRLLRLWCVVQKYVLNHGCRCSMFLYVNSCIVPISTDNVQ